ncbi:unnamed protein product [Ambrosiozyma monospora]|uniref:Unnamed protein product n=1 Tax=Ambrosiozyma monospora TaxID=43982 RepID=A0A9W7DCD2_AMBMO|nr:unnamed protein product [Ambrosiozyma monospora]
MMSSSPAHNNLHNLSSSTSSNLADLSPSLLNASISGVPPTSSDSASLAKQLDSLESLNFFAQQPLYSSSNYHLQVQQIPLAPSSSLSSLNFLESTTTSTTSPVGTGPGTGTTISNSNSNSNSNANTTTNNNNNINNNNIGSSTIIRDDFDDTNNSGSITSGTGAGGITLNALAAASQANHGGAVSGDGPSSSGTYPDDVDTSELLDFVPISSQSNPNLHYPPAMNSGNFIPESLSTSSISSFNSMVHQFPSSSSVNNITSLQQTPVRSSTRLRAGSTASIGGKSTSTPYITPRKVTTSLRRSKSKVSDKSPTHGNPFYTPPSFMSPRISKHKKQVSISNTISFTHLDTDLQLQHRHSTSSPIATPLRTPGLKSEAYNYDDDDDDDGDDEAEQDDLQDIPNSIANDTTAVDDVINSATRDSSETTFISPAMLVKGENKFGGKLSELTTFPYSSETPNNTQENLPRSNSAVSDPTSNVAASSVAANAFFSQPAIFSSHDYMGSVQDMIFMDPNDIGTYPNEMYSYPQQQQQLQQQIQQQQLQPQPPLPPPQQFQLQQQISPLNQQQSSNYLDPDQYSNNNVMIQQQFAQQQQEILSQQQQSQGQIPLPHQQVQLQQQPDQPIASYVLKSNTMPQLNSVASQQQRQFQQQQTYPAKMTRSRSSVNLSDIASSKEAKTAALRSVKQQQQQQQPRGPAMLYDTNAYILGGIPENGSIMIHHHESSQTASSTPTSSTSQSHHHSRFPSVETIPIAAPQQQMYSQAQVQIQQQPFMTPPHHGSISLSSNSSHPHPKSPSKSIRQVKSRMKKSTSVTLNELKQPEKLDLPEQSARSKSRSKSSPDHEKKKIHECPLCHSRFQRPEHVKRHMRSHSSEKPFACPQPNCGKRFNRNDNLKQHLRKIHGVNPQTHK